MTTGPHMRNQSKSCKWMQMGWNGWLLDAFGTLQMLQSWFNILKMQSTCYLFRSPGCEQSLKWVENRRSSLEGSKDSLQHVQTHFKCNECSHSSVIVKYFLSGAQQWQFSNQLGLKSTLAKAEAPREPTQRPWWVSRGCTTDMPGSTKAAASVDGAGLRDGNRLV